jgi:carboxymethylenebutenolidase
MKTVAVAIASLAVVGYVFVAQRTGAVEQTKVAAHDHAGHLSAIEQVTLMAKAGDEHAEHALEELAWPPMQAAPANMKLPADADGAKARLASSPRKGEYVKVNVNGKDIVNWVVHPQGGGKAPVVVVIQEVFGLSDWIRGVADQLAAEGFVAIAPDLLTGRGPNGGDTPAFATDMERTAATRAVPPADVTAMLKASREYALKLPEANGKSASVGFCFGGSECFRLALDEPGMQAAVVYYGSAPNEAPAAPQGQPAPPFQPTARIANLTVPILGLYGGIAQDVNIGRSIAPTFERTRAAMKVYEPHVFDGAAHGFLRAQTGNNGANMRASEQAWPLTVAWIKKYAGETGGTR